MYGKCYAGYWKTFFTTSLRYIDNEFEKNITNPEKAFNNPAGRLIDLIEERLPVKPSFIKEARAKAQKIGWVTLDEIERSLNV